MLRRIDTSLDALNLPLADVRSALPSDLNVFLVTEQGWSQSSLGMVTTIGGSIALAAHTRIGAAIDSTPAKHGVIVGLPHSLCDEGRRTGNRKLITLSKFGLVS